MDGLYQRHDCAKCTALKAVLAAEVYQAHGGDTFRIERRLHRVCSAHKVMPPCQPRVAALVQCGNDVGW